MTCMVGLVDGGEVYMGADSMAAQNWDARQSSLPKVFSRDEFLIGYSTSFRMGQLLQYKLKITPRNKEPVMAYMVETFVEDVRCCLKEYGYTKIENSQEEGGDILVGFCGRLFHIADDFHVNEYLNGFTAIGCGFQYALGVMQALVDIPAKHRVRTALEISAYFSNGVSEPFYVKKLDAVSKTLIIL